jgi:hypothetical protein
LVPRAKAAEIKEASESRVDLLEPFTQRILRPRHRRHTLLDRSPGFTRVRRRVIFQAREVEGKGFVLDRSDRDDGIRHLVDDFWKGHLTRRGFLARAAALGLSAAVATGLLGVPTVARRAGAQGSSTEVTPRPWEQGTGWVWGGDDEVGNLNELSPELALKALSLVEEGKVYDLGLTYDRESFKFPGHNPGEVMSFRTSSGMLTQEDLSMVTDEEENSTTTTFASSALFISDNVATQLDTLGHITEGDPRTLTTTTGPKTSRVTGGS